MDLNSEKKSWEYEWFPIEIQKNVLLIFWINSRINSENKFFRFSTGLYYYPKKMEKNPAVI